MSNKNKGFEIFVIVFVILTGAGFGTLTGLFYSRVSYWWIGTIVGTVSGYPLAKLYLKQLVKISAKWHNRKMVWLLSTLVAIICGVICTTLVHTVMVGAMLQIKHSKPESLLLVVIGIAELIGACAGLIVGGICSWVYVFRIMKESNETA